MKHLLYIFLLIITASIVSAEDEDLVVTCDWEYWTKKTLVLRDSNKAGMLKELIPHIHAPIKIELVPSLTNTITGRTNGIALFVGKSKQVNRKTLTTNNISKIKEKLPYKDYLKMEYIKEGTINEYLKKNNLKRIVLELKGE